MIVQVIGHNVRGGQLSTRSVPTPYNTVFKLSVAVQQRQVPRLPIA